jgi:Mn-dependent DtxR family transcriptional regulator
MNQLDALQRLRALATPVVETRDVAALLQISISSATTILRRLTQKGDDHPPKPRPLAGAGKD